MKLMLSTAAALALVAGMAMAADPAPAASTGGEAKVMHHSLKHCEKEATDKKLQGDERAKFIKECQAGKGKTK